MLNSTPTKTKPQQQKRRTAAETAWWKYSIKKKTIKQQQQFGIKKLQTKENNAEKSQKQEVVFAK